MALGFHPGAATTIALKSIMRFTDETNFLKSRNVSNTLSIDLKSPVLQSIPEESAD
jgi:hypothetical protein